MNIEISRLKETVQHFSSFPTRNTSTEYLTQAANEIADRYRAIPGMNVELFSYPIHKGPRVPEDKTVVEVVATLPGEDDEVVMMGGHLDSINMHAPIVGGMAPGANDDLSGVAATLEVARIMATKKWSHTCKFIAFSGEEQGLFGSSALAHFAKEHNWKILGFLNNDTVGSSGNLQGQSDPRHIRVFSEEKPELHQSREFARYIEWLAASTAKADNPFYDRKQVRRRGHPQFGVTLGMRRDRFGRGGDHTPFNNAGFTAVRLTEPYEEYTHQHTPNDTIQYMDFEYLAKVANLNLLAMSALAQSEPAPSDVRIERDQSHDTTLTWHGDSSHKYAVYWRRTAISNWEYCTVVTGTKAVIEKVSKDDVYFAVGSLGGIPVPAE